MAVNTKIKKINPLGAALGTAGGLISDSMNIGKSVASEVGSGIRSLTGIGTPSDPAQAPNVPKVTSVANAPDSDNTGVSAVAPTPASVKGLTSNWAEPSTAPMQNTNPFLSVPKIGFQDVAQGVGNAAKTVGAFLQPGADTAKAQEAATAAQSEKTAAENVPFENATAVTDARTTLTNQKNAVDQALIRDQTKTAAENATRYAESAATAKSNLERDKAILDEQLASANRKRKIANDNTIADQQNKLNAIRQNIGFFAGQPGYADTVQAMNGLSAQVWQADKVMGQILELSSLGDRNADLTSQQLENQFKDNLASLQYQLDSKLTQSQQNAITKLEKFKSDHAAGIIDADQLDNETNKILDQIAFTTTQNLTSQSKYLENMIGNYDAAVKNAQSAITSAREREAAEAKAATEAAAFDPALSAASGRLVSKDGNPIKDASGNVLAFDPTGVAEIISKGIENGADANGNLTQGLWVKGKDGQVRFQPVNTPALTDAQVSALGSSIKSAYMSNNAEAIKSAFAGIDNLDPQTKAAVLAQLPTAAQQKYAEQTAILKAADKLSSTDPDVKRAGVVESVQTAMDSINKAMDGKIPFVRSAYGIADAIIQRMDNGQSFGQAFDEEFWKPTNAKTEYKDALQYINDAAKAKLDETRASIEGKQAATTATTRKTNAEYPTTTGGNDLSSLYTGNNGPAFANNNPGNIKDTSFGGSAGGQGGFTKFNTVEQGISALLQKIDYNKANGVNGVNNGSAYNGNMTLGQYFQKYAPSSDNNDPIAYAQAVAKATGTTVDTPIKNVDTEQMAMAIMKHENGAVYNELMKRGIVGPEGINLSTSQTKTGGAYNEAQQGILSSLNKKIQEGKSLTASDLSILKQNGLTTSDAYSYTPSESGVDLSKYSSMQDLSLSWKANEGQRKSYAYGVRMDDAMKTLNSYDNTAKNSSAIGLAWEGKIPNFLKSEERQQVEQAQRQFVNAVLRQESGAVISDSEFENTAKQYFPQPGDTESVIDQKRKNREIAIKTMFSQAGNDDQGVPMSQIYQSLLERQNPQIEWQQVNSGQTVQTSPSITQDESAMTATLNALRKK